MLKSVKSKLFAILVGMVAVVLVVAGVSFRARQQADVALDEVITNQLPSAIALGRVSSALVGVRLWTRLGVVDLAAQSQERGAVDRQRRDAALVELERAWSDYAALPMGPQEVELWRDFTARFSTFKSENEQVWAAVASKDVDRSQAHLEPHQQVTVFALEALGKVVEFQAAGGRRQRLEVRETHASANWLLLGVVLASLLSIVLAGTQLVHGIVSRTTALKDGADSLARGDFDVELAERSEDEFGALHDAMRGVVDSLRDSARAAASVANGDLDVQVVPRGPRDQLATTINRMVRNLKDTARQANLIALGDLSAEFSPGSEKDELGIALRTMTANLREATAAADAIADGDLGVGVVAKGPRDVLASAINRMVATLKNTARQANHIAVGDFTADVVPRGVKDELGLALKTMTETLRESTAAAEAVANGHLDVVVASKGPRDAQAAAVNRMLGILKEASRQANLIAAGDYSEDIVPRSDQDELGIALQRMTVALRDAAREARDSDWMKSGVAKINELVLGQDDPQVLATVAVSAVARHLDAKVGVLYVLDEDAEGPVLRLFGSYAYAERKNLASRFRIGEGLVGQAALERKQIVIQNAPEDYVRVVSGLGEMLPRNICVAPILYKEQLRAVVELGTLSPLSRIQQEYVDQVAAVVGTALEIARNQEVVGKQQAELRVSNDELKQQQRSLELSSQELKAQQVELEQSNEELEVQMRRTQESEARLKVQQRELEGTNQELEERNRRTEQQKLEIERAGRDLATQAEELATASKYKSEFLANMSHELRTPLNSLLLLARSLRDDRDGNLTPDQKESAGVIFASGNDLLNLINEILDLAKIEAGRMDLRLETVEPADVARTLVQQFDHMARSQGLTLEVKVEPGLPERFVTDPKRLGQVLKNLVGNALKFTDKGGVTVRIAPAGPGVDLSRSGLGAGRAVAIRIVDTGIGIPQDKQKVIFEAFQQVDSGDRRRYGGTGLGLSISREIVALLGGEIQLQSEPGVGSTFTLYLPFETRGAQPPGPESTRPVVSARPRSHTPASGLPVVASAPVVDGVSDDRDAIEDQDRTILIIEDDARFAAVLAKEVRRRGFKCLVALRGADGLTLARSFRPTGVILDINLPDTNGWSVLAALKQDVDTRHVPVHIVSAEDATLEGLRIGAIGHAHKPLRTEDIDAVLATIEKSSATAEKTVLVVENDPVMSRATCRIIGNGNVHVQECATGLEALAALRRRRFDLLVLDLGLPDMQGLALLEAASAEKIPMPPVIVYTVRDLTLDEETHLRQYASSIIIKDVRSQERLTDEVALFLHRVVNDLPEEKRLTIRHIYESDEQLRGKKILIVEDDMRTMFAMSKLLASHGVNPVKAADGQQALTLLDAQPDVDLVLLDMMMPVMDGYEAAQRIRSQERFGNLPIIALTAKAMKEDRQKCIDAGATDYLSKPVDQDRLVSLLRVWLCR